MAQRGTVPWLTSPRVPAIHLVPAHLPSHGRDGTELPPLRDW